MCAAMVGASGAAVTASFLSAPGHVMCVTDELSEQLEELQLTFGEGPRVDAYADGAPVLVPDLDAAGVASRWPAFGPAARLAGAAAVFALPTLLRRAAAGPGQAASPGRWRCTGPRSNRPPGCSPSSWK
jgi:hypothetical protein